MSAGSMSEPEVRQYERIEESGDVQGLAWRVEKTVAAHVEAARRDAAQPLTDVERAALGERLHVEGFYAPAVRVRIAAFFDSLLQDRAAPDGPES